MKSFLAIVLLRDVPFWTETPFMRWMRRLALLAYLYAGFLMLLLWLEDRFLHPGWWTGKEHNPAPLGSQDVELRLADGTLIDARWFAPTGWQPEDGAILHSHGNGGNHSWRDGQVELWRKRFKQAMLLYDYPGYGRSEGRPTEAGLYASGEAAYRWLIDTKKVRGEDILLLGESLGGAVAIELARRHECRAVVTLGAFTSFPSMAQAKFPWLPVYWLVRNRMDNLEKIGALRVPVFIQHGTLDGTVPYWMGERLAAAAPPGSRFFRTEGGLHRHPTEDAFFKAVEEWLAGHAK
ncbi:MAG: alpha/beta hydrolase [Gemmataceae bacterium]|nr:alpha/beta hydrolase [Gemmataceae bacterium]